MKWRGTVDRWRGQPYLISDIRPLHLKLNVSKSFHDSQFQSSIVAFGVPNLGATEFYMDIIVLLHGCTVSRYTI